MNLLLVSVLILLCCFFSMMELTGRKGYGILFVILAGIFVYAVAVRNVNVVPDSANYINFYNWISAKNSFNVFRWNVSSNENGFTFLLLIAKKLNLSYEELFGVIALIELFVYMRAMSIMRVLMGWRKDFYCVYFSVWCGFWGLFYGAIVLRSGLAISFAFLSHAFILTGRKYKGLFYGLIAFMFHRTIIIYPLIVISSRLISVMSRRKSFIALFVLMTAWVMRLQNVLFPLMLRTAVIFLAIFLPIGNIVSRYIEYAIGFVNGMIGLRAPLLMAFFIAVRPRNNKYYDYMQKIFFMNLIFSFVTSSVAIGGRLNSICMIVMLPMLCFYLLKNAAKLYERCAVCSIFIVWQFIVSLKITGIS